MKELTNIFGEIIKDMETKQLQQLQKKQRTTNTLTFRLARGDRKKIDLLKAHYRQTSASAAIKLAIGDAVDRINKSRDSIKLNKDLLRLELNSPPRTEGEAQFNAYVKSQIDEQTNSTKDS